MDILETRFKKFLTDEGLKPKNDEALKLLERAFFTGATEYYHAIQSTGQEAKRKYKGKDEKILTIINAKITELRVSMSKYWKSQVVAGTDAVMKPQSKLISLKDFQDGK
jgi:hypothetical protein